MSEDATILPAHIEETIQAIARLQAEHRQNATPLQHAVERVTAFVGRTVFVGGLTLVIAGWIGANLLAGPLHLPALDPPPFAGMQSAAGVLALFITVFILSTQRRENQLSELREQLNLELVITSEQKIAKVIRLIEELRRDTPQVVDRYDPEAEVMAVPADPEVMLEVIRETQEIGLAPAEPGAEAGPEPSLETDDDRARREGTGRDPKG